MKKLALIVSRIFEPMIVFSGLLVAGALRANLRGTTLVRFLATVFVSMILPAAALRFFLFRAYRIDWDIRERSKRIVPLFLLLGLSVINFWIVQRWNNSLLTDMFLLFLFWMAGFFAITLFWKISGHTSIATLACGLLLNWYGWQYWPILLIIPTVVWARVVGKNHTLSQAVGGIVYSTLLHEIWKSFL